MLLHSVRTERLFPAPYAVLLARPSKPHSDSPRKASLACRQSAYARWTSGDVYCLLTAICLSRRSTSACARCSARTRCSLGACGAATSAPDSTGPIALSSTNKRSRSIATRRRRNRRRSMVDSVGPTQSDQQPNFFAREYCLADSGSKLKHDREPQQCLRFQGVVSCIA